MKISENVSTGIPFSWYKTLYHEVKEAVSFERMRYIQVSTSTRFLALLTVEDATSTVLRKAGILLLLDAASYSSRKESSATPLRKPRN